MFFSDSVQIPLTDLKTSIEIRFFRVCSRLSHFRVMLLSLATILWALSCIDCNLDLAVSPKLMYTLDSNIKGQDLSLRGISSQLHVG